MEVEVLLADTEVMGVVEVALVEEVMAFGVPLPGAAVVEECATSAEVDILTMVMGGDGSPGNPIQL